MAIEPQQYGFQMILGMGFGLGLSGLIVVARMEVGAEHSAILLASLTQIRVLAGCIALAIASTLLTSHSTSTLQCILTPAQIAAILQSAASIADLPQEEMLATRAVFGDAYRLVWQVMTGVSGAGWVVTWGAWKRARDVKGLAEMKREQEGREGGGSGESSGVKGGGDAGASQA
ncbi:hypothetical protein MMC15_000308 [Xylographa vitiligo]|nr:hypothetical protein [Xylographa vitiligo]